MNISLKSKIRHWFEFLRLAHQSTDPVIVKNLLKSKQFYKDWGNYREISFTKWWTEHRHLFRNVSSLRRMTSQDKFDDSALYLVIPFTYAPTTVAKIVQRIYDEEQKKRTVTKNKVKKIYGGSFGLSTEDFQASQFSYYFRYARDVYLPLTNNGGKVKTKDFIEKAVISFSKQKLVTSWEDSTLARRKVPFKESSHEYANLSKRARDFNLIVKNILLNVSLGIFPGDYLTTSVKNQNTNRKIKKPYLVRSHSRGVPLSRYVNKKKREDTVDPYRKFVK